MATTGPARHGRVSCRALEAERDRSLIKLCVFNLQVDMAKVEAPKTSLEVS